MHNVHKWQTMMGLCLKTLYFTIKVNWGPTLFIIDSHEFINIRWMHLIGRGRSLCVIQLVPVVLELRRQIKKGKGCMTYFKQNKTSQS
jgi:hypothetical protein